MHIVQHMNGQILESKTIMYISGSGSTFDLKPGYVLCYKIDAPVTPAAGNFDDYVLGRVAEKPATANLTAFAGIVKALGPRISPTSTTDYSRWCDIIIPRRGEHFQAFINVNMTANSTTLNPGDNSWYLIGSGTGYTIVAVASETANTSSTAFAIKWCRALV